MDNNELEAKVFSAYRTAWIETINQLLIVKAQCELLTEKLQQSDEKVKHLEKEIEALNNKIVQHNKPPQVQKQEQK